MTILASTDRAYDKALRKIVTRARTQGAGVEKSVRTILKAVERAEIVQSSGTRRSSIGCP